MKVARSQAGGTIQIHPLTADRWPDLEGLFGKNGACGGCWCMYWRLIGRDFRNQKGEPNRQAFRSLVRGGQVPGLLAYAGDRPVAWVAVEPREAYPRLERSRTLKPIDDRLVWSVTCFFVARGFRRQGITVRLLQAAAEHVRSHGGEVLEGQSGISQRRGRRRTRSCYTGLPGAFLKAGFIEVARPSETRPIVRRVLAAP